MEELLGETNDLKTFKELVVAITLLLKLFVIYYGQKVPNVQNDAFGHRL
jgi:hypothetical protein